MSSSIYLDSGATTPCDPRVVAAMLPYFTEQFGNASSPHFAGSRAHEAVETAREQVAGLLNGRPEEIIWTSGATESNNLLLRGVAHSALRGPLSHKGMKSRRKIAISAIEHKSVSEVARALESDGFEVVVLPVDSVGRVRLDAARETLDEQTLLVCVQAANGEIGTIQPMGELADLAHERGALFHCDASQAAGKIPLDVAALDIDVLSLSAHKMYGPQGVGALWVRRALRPLLVSGQVGGGQERGLRAGTLNVPGIVGLGKACGLCESGMKEESARLSSWRDELELRLRQAVPGVCFNGDYEHRLPHQSSLTFPGVEASLLLARLPELALSGSAACDSGALAPSQTLQTIGLSREDAASTIRVGLHRFNRREEVEEAAARLIGTAKHLRIQAQH